ncbi:MAG TPA: sigma-54 dependent transcriptional regulator [Casimicrobiaceae bacterium]|nr:sigma-54 dependent transcriptional regulator [Casimicrobiaceae bacterium]
MARILVADDERSICDAFSLLLEAEGHTPLIASTGEGAIRLVRTARPDLVFVDVRMPGMDGLAVLKEIRRANPALPVVVMTAYGTLETAAEALRNEAFDYLGKPLDLGQIRQVLRRALHSPAPESQTTSVPSGADAGPRPTLVGQSAPMQELFKLIVMLADNDLTALVQGESGVGKELVARAIHESGSRAAEPFVAINCAAIPEQLIESELFGHERGAFTDAKSVRTGRFEAAGQGTLFLDEISELPLHLQSKLLRVLQERSFERVGGLAPVPFRARLVCASNRDLASAVAAGTFREDLYHRVNIVTLHVPPLRERREDIPELVQALVQRANREVGKAITSVEQAVLESLKTRDWRGNVRELEHVIKRSLLVAHGPVLTVHDLDFDPENSAPTVDGGSGLDGLLGAIEANAARLVDAAVRGGIDLPVHDLAVGRLEDALIRNALKLTAGNQVAAARLLGISRSTLRSKLQG